MKRIIFISSLLLAVCACNKAEMNAPEVGYGMLSMNVNVEAQTKAALTSEELLNTASVKIYKANHKGLVRSYAYSEMPSPFYLAADTYRVDVEAGEAVKETPAVASWEQKSYKGSKEFTITANQVTTVEVEATVNNAVTAITFDETVAENFAEGYTFSIGLDAETQLVYDASNSGAEGYFIVDGLKNPSFSWTFNGTLAKDGSEFAKTGVIENILPGRLYRMALRYTVKDGDLEFTLLVDYTTDVFDDTIVFEPVSTGLAMTPVYEIWATRATLHADVDLSDNPGASVQFAYASEGTDWVVLDGVDDNDGTFHVVATGLLPATTYTYKLLVDGEQAGDVKTLTTDIAPNLPNASFEYYSIVAGHDFYKFYDPNSNVEGANYKFWASGNGDEESIPGSLGLPGKYEAITVIDKDNKVDGENSVLAQSKAVLGTKLAAGNLFTGQFVRTEGTSGGIVNFGRPWTSRPTALKIHVRYATGVIDWLGDLPAGVDLVKNQSFDRAQIKVALGTWNNRTYGGTAASPVQVNTTQASTFVDFYTDESTIANGDIIVYNDGYEINKGEKVTATTDAWVEYIIPLDYRDLQTFPTHIIISCAASQYGDYFTGSTSSRLWLDKFELIYE